MNMEAKVRDSNIELMRILLMTMILLSHLISHGKYDFPDSSVVLSIQDSAILTFTRYHVNTFILISGFFGVTLKFRKIFNFILLIYVWAIIGAIVDFSIFGSAAIGNIASALINPFMSGWFLIQYFALMLYAPLLNKGLEDLSNRNFSILLVIYLLFIYGVLPSIISASSPHTFQFIAMYLIGRYLNRNQSYISQIKWRNILLFNILGGALLFILVIIFRSHYQLYSRLLSNQDPIVIFMGINLFVLFKKIKIGYIPVVNKIAAGVIVAYLLTDCTFTGRWLDKFIYSFSNDNALILILAALILTVSFAALEFCRKSLFTKLEDTVYVFCKGIVNRYL